MASSYRRGRADCGHGSCRMCVGTRAGRARTWGGLRRRRTAPDGGPAPSHCTGARPCVRGEGWARQVGRVAADGSDLGSAGRAEAPSRRRGAQSGHEVEVSKSQFFARGRTAWSTGVRRKSNERWNRSWGSSSSTYFLGVLLRGLGTALRLRSFAGGGDGSGDQLRERSSRPGPYAGVAFVRGRRGHGWATGDLMQRGAHQVVAHLLSRGRKLISAPVTRLT